MRTFVFNNKPQLYCYGCQSCIQICPHDAITMITDEEGFIYPQINSNKCVDCGLCEKSCPTQTTFTHPLFHETPRTVYAAWNKQLDGRLNSTSGGLFYLLALHIIDLGGVIYGVDYRTDMTAFHNRVKDIEGLKRLRGSKYMQSDINTIYKQVKEDLNNGTKVLFSGTPCQIAGLRLFLHRPYDNLITRECQGIFIKE